MGILLAITVMVVAGACLLIAFTLRTWSRTHEERFADMHGQVVKYNEHITALQAAMTTVNNDLDETISTVAKIKEEIVELRVELNRLHAAGNDRP